MKDRAPAAVIRRPNPLTLSSHKSREPFSGAAVVLASLSVIFSAIRAPHVSYVSARKWIDPPPLKWSALRYGFRAKWRSDGRPRDRFQDTPVVIPNWGSGMQAEAERAQRRRGRRVASALRCRANFWCDSSEWD